MSSEDRRRWEEKYAEGFPAPSPPDPFVCEVLDGLHLPQGARALDLACGPGRHALELAARGFEVEAWDVSGRALAELQSRAEQARLAERVRVREVDLDAAPPADVRLFDVAVVVDYLDRALPERVAPLLAPGGRLILATFTEDWPGERPSARHRLRRGELARGVPGYEVEHGVEAGGRAGVLLRRESRE